MFQAVYWSGYTDNCGNPLVIGSNYVMNVTSRPPANAFWSLTLYNASDYFLINTTNNVYTLGSQFPDLVLNDDGGAVLYLSQYLPSGGIPESNWLPLGVQGTPGDLEFYGIFRIYSPTSPDVVNTYVPAPIVLTDENYVPIACP